MRRTTRRAGLLAALLGVAALPACASRGIPVREYVLTSAGSPGPIAPARRELTIGVGPVVVPRYLQGSGIVTRVGPNELRASDSHRWGEELDRGLARVVAENLAALVPAAWTEAYPWRDTGRLDYRIPIEVQRFERKPDGSVTLEADWAVLRGSAATIVARQRASFAEEGSGQDYAASVAAMSRAAARLSDQIAAAIRADAGLAGAE